MPYKIEDIEGIGPTFGEKLKTANIRSTDDLLKVCCDARGRKEASAKTGISEGQLLKWANMADLMRIKGVGPEYAELLEAAGVDTVKELRNRNGSNLAGAMEEVNKTKKLTRQVPAVPVVEGWVGEAKTLDPKISH